MGYVIVWQFVAAAGREQAFESAYGPDGDWVRFFRADPRYVRTDLVRDTENSRRYCTLDFWESQQAYDDFRIRHADEYFSIDARCEALTESEELIGKFLSVAPVAAGR
jgi:hypothetical protein